jgi:FMN phosphatase YigB (HAD superfamily)
VTHSRDVRVVRLTNLSGQVRELRTLSIRTALVSNTDSRMRKPGFHNSFNLIQTPHSTDLVLRDLEVASYLDPVILSEETGVDKPSPVIFLKACRELNGSHTLKPEQCVHVGDELDW